MKKSIMFIALGLFIILISLSYGEEPTVYQEVYYDNEAGENHFRDMVEALDHVDENGVLYVGKPIYISSSGVKSLNIIKSMTIKGIGNQESKVNIIGSGVGPVFNLKNVTSFQLEGIEATGGNVAVVKGAAEYIVIKDCKFLNCVPINTTASSVKEVILVSNEVTGGSVYIEPYTYGTQVIAENNRFTVAGSEVRGFNLKNCHMTIENNYFHGVSFKISEGVKATGWIQYNTFGNDGRKLLINETNQALHFQNNKIYKAGTGEVDYQGSEPLDFTRNWWGSKEGPQQGVIDGNIDYSNWALFEDFRRYKDDPYTLTDLEEAYRSLEKDVDTDNWIYDMDENNHINFLDIIAITRQISDYSSLPLYSMAYGTEPCLDMRVNQDEIMLHETFTIDITAKDIDNIAGGDILLYYDDTKLKLTAKEIKLDDFGVIDFQQLMAKTGDLPGEVRIRFGLMKDKPLLEGSEVALAVLTFEAIDTGNTAIPIETMSQLVKESLGEAELSYHYVNPWIASQKRIRISTPALQMPEDESNDESSQNSADAIDKPSGNNAPASDAVGKNDRFSESHGNIGDKTSHNVLDIHSITQDGLKLCSEIYWIDAKELTKELTIPYAGDHLDIHRLGIYYYHEVKRKWIYLGGEVHGNTLTVSPIEYNINFNKFAVLEDRSYPAFIDIEVEDMSPDLVKILTLGIMKGYEDLTLRLDQAMSREEWTTAWILALDVPLKEDGQGVDAIDGSLWAQVYVRTAVELLGDEVYIGQENLTMKEAVEVLEKAMKKIYGSAAFQLLREKESDVLLTRRQAVGLLAQALRYLNI